ncbi:hypothetical protein SAMN05444678_102238 [Sphingomonas sp. YR710]|uniref:hypothetical protein n=1 Tax=Sphingomonas sp. YR710 TaxID=1882773 RepID=UPI000880B2D6|nr:hypothetical protein [Sphingomonas sp. YR710]SDC30061.1 hypothetical protein SAMN05444678_102238 [Sphingomonas sp. YR710]
MSETARIYGEFATGAAVRPVRADHILGCRIELDAKRRPDQLAVQFRNPDGFHEVRMDFVQALFLLSTLKAIQLDTGTSFPDDPRAIRDNPLC